MKQKGEHARKGKRRALMRPVAARWFELLTVRDDLTLALETLARTRSVELETHSVQSGQRLPDLHGQMEEYHRLAQRYKPFWPTSGLRPSRLPGQPADTLEHALAALHAWAAESEPRVAELERLHAERGELELLAELLAGLGDSPLRPELLRTSEGAVIARLFVLPPGSRLEELPAGVLATLVSAPRHEYLIAVGTRDEVDALEHVLSPLKGRRLPWHPVLKGDVASSRSATRERIDAIERRNTELRGRLDALSGQHRLPEALGDIHRLEWFLSHLGALAVTENFAWVTGWTSDPEGGVLTTAIETAGIRGILRFPDPPQGKDPPMVMRNPGWTQPFEVFARLMGTPAKDEADPTFLLAFITPLLFGYMFGDLGQGAVLFLAGLLLRRRWPGLGLLIAAGLSSMLFGLLFGSVFGREDLLPALWLHPLEAPITLLLMPLVGGALLLLLGMGLGGLEARWRGEGGRWLRRDAGLLLLYVGGVGAFFYPPFGWLVPGGLVWYLLGIWWLNPGREGAAMAAGVGAILETSLQLAVNTLSFARVGAFALAHAGLSSAVVALAEATDRAILSLLILLIGNGVIILLEGLVVSIQLTRLVLFEFFIRFLRGEGRGFKPLEAPPSAEER